MSNQFRFFAKENRIAREKEMEKLKGKFTRTYFIEQSNYRNGNTQSCMVGLISFVGLPFAINFCAFFILLQLKINDKLNVSYHTVFIPLYIFFAILSIYFIS